MPTEGAVAQRNKMEFQAEVKQLLNIVINSLYTHKEIFLRELIANASDALDKLRLLSLTDPLVLEDSPVLSIFIEIDAESKTLTISDNGIGMSYDEVVENIGVIARSGSANFAEYLKKNRLNDVDLDLIGHFGVGFYSAFMVAEEVTLLTRPPKQTMGVRWVSTGDGTYEIEEAEKKERGTTVILKLKDAERDPNNFDEDFLNQYTIQKHIQKHCNFIAYPIRMNFVSEEPERDGDGETVEAKKQIVVTEKTLNSIQPIWAKDPKEIDRDQYMNFYRQQFHDWNEPAEIIHTRGEGVVEFTALFFIPSHAPYGLYTGDAQKGPHLYCKHVLVVSDCRELLPDYLRFARGIVDSPDLPLNISRETLQHTRPLQSIKNHLEKKVIDAFKSILARDRKKYDDLWAEYGKAIKGGIFMDYKNAEKLQDLLLFETSASPDAKTTLEEYVGRMSEDQKAIYYVTGESRSAVERLPQMEVFKARNIEVLYFLDKVDEFLTQHMREYAGKKLQSISRGDLDIEAEKKDEGQAEAKKEDHFEELLDFMRKNLSDKVKDVRISKRLISSPVCLVSGDSGYTLNMERLMREANQPIFKATRILEVNPEHQVIRTMQRLVKSGGNESKLLSYCQLLYDQALLIDNDRIEDPIRFASIISELFVDAYKV
jgi:molecular chaperone HtpG